MAATSTSFDAFRPEPWKARIRIGLYVGVLAILELGCSESETIAPVETTGACCVDEQCLMTTQAQCSGDWDPQLACDPNPCPKPAPPDIWFETNEVWLDEGGWLTVRVHRAKVGDVESVSVRLSEFGDAEDADLSARDQVDFRYPAQIASPYTILGLSDKLVEGEELAILELVGKAGESLSSLHVTIVDPTPSELQTEFSAALRPGMRWEYSSDEHQVVDGGENDLYDVTRVLEVGNTVRWRGKDWIELLREGTPWMLWRQEQSRLFGFFPSDTLATGYFGEVTRKSLPWLLADFDEEPGTIWVAIDADSLSEDDEPHSMDVITTFLEGRRVGTLVGLFPDVRALSVDVVTRSPWLVRSTSIQFWLAHDFGPVRVVQGSSVRGSSQRSPTSDTKRQALRSWAGDPGANPGPGAREQVHE